LKVLHPILLKLSFYCYILPEGNLISPVSNNSAYLIYYFETASALVSPPFFLNFLSLSLIDDKDYDSNSLWLSFFSDIIYISELF
jgi:hypothetical protein